MDKLRLLEREMILLSGPLAGFVIRKQIKDMGLEGADFPDEKFPELIKRVVENAVYDKSTHTSTIIKLRKRLIKLT